MSKRWIVVIVLVLLLLAGAYLLYPRLGDYYVQWKIAKYIANIPPSPHSVEPAAFQVESFTADDFASKFPWDKFSKNLHICPIEQSGHRAFYSVTNAAESDSFYGSTLNICLFPRKDDEFCRVYSDLKIEKSDGFKDLNADQMPANDAIIVDVLQPEGGMVLTLLSRNDSELWIWRLRQQGECEAV